MGSPTIAVGVTATSYPALAWAVAEAAATGSRLAICHVCRADSPLAGRARVSPALLELTDPALSRAVTAARDRLGGNRVDLIIEVGHIGEALVRAAGGAELLVVGAPEHTGWGARRSTTHHAVQHATRPIVVVRTAPFVPRGPFAGHVVVGVDGSPPAREALAFAFRWAAAHRTPLVALNVTAAQGEDVWFDESMLETHFAVEPSALAMLAGEIEPWRVRYPGVRVKRALFAGEPSDGLTRAAAGAIMLAVGDRGLGPVARAAVGSVAHAAVDEAPCPVAVVPTAHLRRAIAPDVLIPANREAVST